MYNWLTADTREFKVEKNIKFKVVTNLNNLQKIRSITNHQEIKFLEKLGFFSNIDQVYKGSCLKR